MTQPIEQTKVREIAEKFGRRIADTVSDEWNFRTFMEEISQALQELSAIHEKEMATGIEAEVCADIAARQTKGIAKYGVPVADNPLPLRDWLRHAYEETLDNAVYLKKAMTVLEDKDAEIAALKRHVEWIWANCRIIYHFPDPIHYPIEHNPHARKDGRLLIEQQIPSPTEPTQ